LADLSLRLVKQQPDIDILRESDLTDHVPATTITIPGYALSHRQDTASRGGGTVVYRREGVLDIDRRALGQTGGGGSANIPIHNDGGAQHIAACRTPSLAAMSFRTHRLGL